MLFPSAECVDFGHLLHLGAQAGNTAIYRSMYGLLRRGGYLGFRFRV